MGIIFLLISFNIIFILLWDNLRRSRRAATFSLASLRPNCLLSPYPLLFLGGKKSIFYFMAYWGDLPRFLAEHGYEVYHLDLPWRTSQKHQDLLHQFLSQQSQMGTQLHLLVDATNETAIENLFRTQHYSCVKSCLMIQEESSANAGAVSSALLKPLNQPIEYLPLTSAGKTWLWRLHEWRRSLAPTLDLRQSLQLNAGTRPHFEKILDQMIFVSERDFNSAVTAAGEPTYEKSSSGFRGDLSSFAELS